MSGLDKAALDALQRRLGHAEAIAKLLAEPLDSELGEALRGVVQMLSDCGDQLDAIVGRPDA